MHNEGKKKRKKKTYQTQRDATAPARADDDVRPKVTNGGPGSYHIGGKYLRNHDNVHTHTYTCGLAKSETTDNGKR